MRSDINVSQMVENWVRAEEEMKTMVRISRSWVKELDVLTLERLEDYCYEKHTTPAETVRRWIWDAKVKNTTMRGQLSLFK